jgi:hypothetical protein
MAENKSYQEKDVESADVRSATEESSWTRTVRKVERSLGIEAQGVTRVHNGACFLSLVRRESLTFVPCRAARREREGMAGGRSLALVSGHSAHTPPHTK